MVRLLEGRTLPTVAPERGVLGEAPLRQLLSKYTEPTEEGAYACLPKESGKRSRRKRRTLATCSLLWRVSAQETEAERRERGFVADRLTAAYHSLYI